MLTSAPRRLIGGPDGRLWLVLGDRVVQTRSGRVVRVWTDVTATDAAPAADPDRLFVTDEAASLLDLDTAGDGRAIARVKLALGTGVTAVAVDEANGWVLRASGTQLSCVTFAGGAGPAVRLTEPDGIRALVLSADRRILYAACPGAITGLSMDHGPAVGRIPTPDATVDDLTLTPAGLVGVDRAAGCVIGINPRHGTATRIWQHDGPLAGVAFAPEHRAYLSFDSTANCMLAVATDGSRAEPLELRYAPAR